jgi:hypothetical protein
MSRRGLASPRMWSVLMRAPGVRDAAVVGARISTEERVRRARARCRHDVDSIVRQNRELADHRNPRALVWPEPELRTEAHAN